MCNSRILRSEYFYLPIIIFMFVCGVFAQDDVVTTRTYQLFAKADNPADLTKGDENDSGGDALVRRRKAQVNPELFSHYKSDIINVGDRVVGYLFQDVKFEGVVEHKEKYATFPRLKLSCEGFGIEFQNVVAHLGDHEIYLVANYEKAGRIFKIKFDRKSGSHFVSEINANKLLNYSIFTNPSFFEDKHFDNSGNEGVIAKMLYGFVHETNEVQVLERIASDAEMEDSYGSSVAVSGDYAVVGASGNNPGSAYILYRNGGGTNNWGEVKRFRSSNPSYSDGFGMSVSISGDNVIVGALDNLGDPIPDRVYIPISGAFIFSRNKGGSENWGEVMRLISDKDVYYGPKVYICGDYALVESQFIDTSRKWVSAVSLLQRNSGGENKWGEINKFIAPDSLDQNDRFGNAFAMSGESIVIGAFEKNRLSGAAYIFSRNQGGKDNWGEVKTLTASDPNKLARFGNSVAIHGDYIIVSAPSENFKSKPQGVAYIFYRNQGGLNNWGEVAKITATSNESELQLAGSVALYGDYALVGSNSKGKDMSKHYSIHAFYRHQGGTNNWGEVFRFAPFDSTGDDLFGRALSLSQDTILIGSAAKTSVRDDAGAVYVISVK